MKNIILFLALSTTILFTSCKGDPGPPGLDGGVYLGQVFEKTVNFQYDFNENNYYSNVISFPSNVEVYESDAILVYRYVVTENGMDVWTQLPQSIFYQDGTGDIFQYNFNHTFVDIQFTIEGNFDLTNIDSFYINNQTFRVAVVPSEYANKEIPMEDLMHIMNVDEGDIM